MKGEIVLLKISLTGNLRKKYFVFDKRAEKKKKYHTFKEKNKMNGKRDFLACCCFKFLLILFFLRFFFSL